MDTPMLILSCLRFPMPYPKRVILALLSCHLDSKITKGKVVPFVYPFRVRTPSVIICTFDKVDNPLCPLGVITGEGVREA